MHILWQSKSALVHQCFADGRMDTSLNGGNLYDLQAMFALKNHFDIQSDKHTVRQAGEGTLNYIYRLQYLRNKADLLIMEPFPAVFGKRSPGQKTMAMIHHIDPEIRSKSFFHKLYFSLLIKRLKQVNKVVTVSSYWKKFLEKAGCENVDVIYNSFDIAPFRSLQKNNPAFRNKYNIPQEVKIIYIGNAIKEKGVYDVYEGLKNSGYHLIMSGAQNRAADLPVQYLHLDREDYLQLLASSSVVIAMSKMQEGWNRIAHEAMLCKTPVIGSGSGGMSELLEMGGQIRLSAPNELDAAVKKVLANENQFATKGYEYVKQFDLNYFERRWVEVVHSVMEN